MSFLPPPVLQRQQLHSPSASSSKFKNSMHLIRGFLRELLPCVTFKPKKLLDRVASIFFPAPIAPDKRQWHLKETPLVNYTALIPASFVNLSAPPFPRRKLLHGSLTRKYERKNEEETTRPRLVQCLLSMYYRCDRARSGTH